MYAPEHITGQDFVKNRSEIIQIFEDAARTYTIPFLDYSNDSMNQHKKYFYNASHLNKKGAELFSRQLTQDLKPLISTYKE